MIPLNNSKIINNRLLNDLDYVARYNKIIQTHNRTNLQCIYNFDEIQAVSPIETLRNIDKIGISK